MATRYTQVYTPQVSVPAQRGWCLKYVDDAGDAPKRTATARIAFNNEQAAKRISVNTPPQGIWVVGFLTFTSGPFVGLGHVFFMKYLGNGKYDIRDSESASGARRAYTNIDQVLAWFGAYRPVYRGWSMWCDGRQYAKSEFVLIPQKPTLKKKNGTAVVAVPVLNVRNAPSTSSSIVAQYRKGDRFNFDSYIDTNGYRWLSYVSYSGVRRYVAQKTLDNKSKFVNGGV